MTIKRLLFLLPWLPALLMAAYAGCELYDLFRPMIAGSPLSPVNRTELRTLKQDLDEHARVAAERGRLKTEVWEAALRVDETDSPPGESELDKALTAHLKRLRKGRHFIEVYAAKSGSLPLNRDDEADAKEVKVYATALDALVRFRDREEGINELASSYATARNDAARSALDAALKEYARQENYRKPYHAAITACMKGIDLERTYSVGGEGPPATGLYKEANEALRGETSRRAVVEKVSKAVKEWQDYAGEHKNAGAPPFARDRRPKEWARRQEEQWDAYGQLLKLAEIGTTLPLKELLPRYEQLYAKALAEDPGAFQRLVRREAERVCGEALPPRLKSDGKVILTHPVTGDKIEREPGQVTVFFKPESPRKGGRLSDLGDAMYTLRKGEIKSLRDDDGIPYDAESGIQPTPYTAATLAYNAGRSGLKWTRGALEKFRDECERTEDMKKAWTTNAYLRKHSTTLNDLIEAMKDCRGLFPDKE